MLEKCKSVAFGQDVALGTGALSATSKALQRALHFRPYRHQKRKTTTVSWGEIKERERERDNKKKHRQAFFKSLFWL